MLAILKAAREDVEALQRESRKAPAAQSCQKHISARDQ